MTIRESNKRWNYDRSNEKLRNLSDKLFVRYCRVRMKNKY